MKDEAKKILDGIIKDLRESDLPAWRRPWNDPVQLIVIGGNIHYAHQWPSNIRAPFMHYGAINGIVLTAKAKQYEYRTNFWIAQKAIKELNAKTCPGAEPVNITAFYEGTDNFVYNIDQIKDNEETLGFAWHESQHVVTEQYEESGRLLQELIKKRSLAIELGGNRACYSPKYDKIKMPTKGQFCNVDEKHGEALYWGTLWHEVVHWTGAPNRLNRTKGNVWGDKKYAFEELVAELGACLLCSRLRIKADIQSASYIKSWLGKASDKAERVRKSYHGKWANCLEKDYNLLYKACELAEESKDYVFKPEKQTSREKEKAYSDIETPHLLKGERT